MDDTLELRDELERAWRSVVDGAIARGCPKQAVMETMAAVAHERFAAFFGPAAAASYLQLLAEQLRTEERNDTVDLIQGHAAPRSAAVDEPETAFADRFSAADIL